VDQSPISHADVSATDQSALDRIKRFGGAKLLADMIALFLVAAPERVAAARTATDAGNADGAEQALHALKSSAAQLGALRMQRLSEQGEQKARAGSTVGLAGIVSELEDELPRVRDWLTRARDQGAA
jgi:HPt (histidine-containing phosphotransfer) domain-containing protein